MVTLFFVVDMRSWPRLMPRSDGVQRCSDATRCILEKSATVPWRAMILFSPAVTRHSGTAPTADAEEAGLH